MELLFKIFFAHPFLLGYLGLINLLTLLVYGIDKVYARAHAWRISERTLLLLALAGGSPGALAGIYLFRHKNRKSIFLLYFSVILIVQLVLIAYYLSPVTIQLYEPLVMTY